MIEAKVGLYGLKWEKVRDAYDRRRKVSRAYPTELIKEADCIVKEDGNIDIPSGLDIPMGEWFLAFPMGRQEIILPTRGMIIDRISKSK